MSYSEQTWQDKPATTTPLSAARMTHIEQGITGAETFATNAVSTHAAATDPHGDRAYTDTEIAAEVTRADGAYIASTDLRDAAVITRAAYDALGTKDANTLYLIGG